MPEDVYAKFLERPDESQDRGNEVLHKDLIGECLDEEHFGDKGWIEIKSFSFGFGFKGQEAASGASTAGQAALAKKLTTGKPLNKQEANQVLNAGQTKPVKPKGKDEKAWGHSGALDFEKFSFSKSADSMSKRLAEICHAGNMIPAVMVVMCRPGGSYKEKQIEFLRLIFEEVYLKSCNLNLATEGLPSEDYQFEYNVVKLESVWTDNAVGDRRPDQPIRAGWNLRDQKQAM